MPVKVKEKPIFIVGQERSGTTMLMAMLGGHPRIAVPEVAWWYPRFRGYLHTYGDLSKRENLRVLADEMIFALRNPLWDMPANPRTIVDEILSELKEPSFAGIYCAMLERYARWVGKPRWGEKTPNNIFFVKEIKEDIPDAQFICLTRDGRDMSADALQSDFGPTNIFCAAECWKLGQETAQHWRKNLSSNDWLDVKYEALAREPEKTLRAVCDFLGEKYDAAMLGFYKSDIAQARGELRDHRPLAQPVSTRYIGIYKELLSLRDQRIYATVAGKVHREEGYDLDVEPIEISEDEAKRYRQLDGCYRAAGLMMPGGRLVLESYNDWLIDQREARRKKGIWKESDIPPDGVARNPHEDHIVGMRAPREWKERLSIKRQYTGAGTV